MNASPTLCPFYLRGQAYLQAGQGQQAAAVFQKLVALKHPLGGLARLQLARAYVLQGDTAKALATYQDFVTLWKDADTEIPILKESKAEYVKLQ